MERLIRGSDNTRVLCTGDPGKGGAATKYEILGKRPSRSDTRLLKIQFQDGPPQENGINGVTNEDLIAIVIDRLKAYQDGPFPCQENANALRSLLESEHWLDRRTSSRKLRNVEGKYEK